MRSQVVNSMFFASASCRIAPQLIDQKTTNSMAREILGMLGFCSLNRNPPYCESKSSSSVSLALRYPGLLDLRSFRWSATGKSFRVACVITSASFSTRSGLLVEEFVDLFERL